MSNTETQRLASCIVSSDMLPLVKNELLVLADWMEENGLEAGEVIRMAVRFGWAIHLMDDPVKPNIIVGDAVVIHVPEDARGLVVPIAVRVAVSHSMDVANALRLAKTRHSER